MAQGLLGSANRSGVSGTTTVYTVPGGISHAVVHITLSTTSGQAGSLNVDVGPTTVLGIVTAPSGTQLNSNASSSVSMMLSPGNVVTFTNQGSMTGSCTVSGYEVP